MRLLSRRAWVIGAGVGIAGAAIGIGRSRFRPWAFIVRPSIPDGWTRIGPGGGGALMYPAVDPFDAEHAIVACDMSGHFVTFDGGLSWSMKNLAGTARGYVFDPSRRGRLYALGVGLFRSDNGGRSFVLIAPTRWKRYLRKGDHAEAEFVTDDMTLTAVDCATNGTLVGCATRDSGFGIVRSSDGGQTWAQGSTMPWAASTLFASPSGERMIAIATDGTIVVVGKDAPETIRAGNELAFVRVACQWAEERFCLCVIEGADEYSAEHSWLLVEGQAPTQVVSKAAISSLGFQAIRYSAIATNDQTILLGFSTPNEIDHGKFGILISRDAGVTWHVLLADSDTAPSAHVRDAWISRAFGPSWGDAPIGLAISKRAPNVLLATDLGRVLRSADDGKMWNERYSSGGSRERYTTRGLDVTTSYAVHHSPHDPNRMLVSCTDIGGMLSEDGGKSWTWVRGVPRPWRNTMYDAVFDPEVRGRIWAAVSDTHDLPRPKMWRRKAPSKFRGGIVQSEDGGLTWFSIAKGLPDAAFTSLWLDPSSRSNARRLLATAFGHGVFRSDDDGRSWHRASDGLPEGAFAWRLVGDNRVYLVCVRQSEGANVSSGQGAVFFADGAASRWSPMMLPEGVIAPTGVTLNPGGAVLLSAWGSDSEHRICRGGIFASTNGQQWRWVLQDDAFIYDVTCDSADPNRIFATGFSGLAWMSVDGGQSFVPIDGYDFAMGHRITVDPYQRENIYITTFGGGVWYGPPRPSSKPACITHELWAKRSGTL